MPELDYHADPAPEPSLSRSIAQLLIDASPAHAYAEHPRLGGTPPTGPASGEEDMDVGTAVHALFLKDGEEKIVHCKVPDWRTKEAKAMKADALAAGKIPLKTKQYDAAMHLYDKLAGFAHRTGLFTEGQGEATLVVDEGDHWFRCRVDFLPDDPSLPLLDLKTTGSLATAAKWGRSCFDHGADLQAAMYPRAAEILRGEPPGGMLFVVIETNPPYAIRIFAMDPIAIEVGNAKARAARALWTQCIKSGEWPAYPDDPEWIIPPSWIVHQWQLAKAGPVGRAMEDPNFIDRLIKTGSFGG
jgi:hypothetical protein